MSLPDFTVVILAAGKGTRLRSRLAKVLHRAGGRSLVEHVAQASLRLKPRAVTVVIGHQAEDVNALLSPLGVRTAIQEPQRGTGHAMLVARRALPATAKFALVVPGDAPLVRTETLAALARAHQESGAAASILSAKLANPSGYGRIVRADDGSVSAIVEDAALTPEQRGIREINSSIYAFTLAKLWPCLARLKPTNVHRELYLTDAIAILRQQGDLVVAELVSDAEEVLGCNTRADLSLVDLAFRRRKRAELMDGGVTIQLPGTVVVDPDVTVGADTILGAGVQLLGRTRVGSGCEIQAGSIIIDSTLDDGVLVKPYCYINASQLAANTQTGPFAHLRFAVRMMKDARLGNFVEAKNSVLGEGVKAMHLTYLGDANVGSHTNVGAGTITCNYDGVAKHPTTIGRRVFIGSDTALVAPVKVGDGAYIGAGSVITENVPPNALGLARGRQVNKPGWATARRKAVAKSAKHSKHPPRSRKSASRSRVRGAKSSPLRKRAAKASRAR